MEPFAVDGRVDLEQMHALLDAQAEYATLDYKQTCNLSDKKARAEFVKDAAAMMSNPNGGYLVVGVDGRGSAVNTTLDGSAFDSAKLKDILTKNLEGEVPVISQHHRTEAGDVVVIYLGRRADRLVPVVKANMTYVDAKGEESSTRAQETSTFATAPARGGGEPPTSPRCSRRARRSFATRSIRQVDGHVHPHQSWLRHADMWASRTQQSESFTDGGTVPGLLIAVARQRLAGVPALRADLAGASTPKPIGEQPAEHDEAMDSLCQADFLWCVVAAAQGRGLQEAFPSFASLFPRRTEPMIERLSTDPALAQAIAPDQTAEELESVVAGILNVARNQNGPWW